MEMSQQNDRYAGLRQEISVVMHRFPAWTEEAEAEDHFGPGELVDFLTEVAKALGQLDVTLVTTAAIVTRLEKLYTWVRGKVVGNGKKTSGMAAEPTVLSGGERILALLVDRIATGRDGMPATQLAAMSGLPLQHYEVELRRLADSGLIHLNGENWVLRHRRNN
jgi:hypothetical protein